MKKEIAMLMGIVMIAALFAALPSVSAYPNYSESNRWNLKITDDGLREAYYSPGEQNVSFNITITNDNGGSDTDDADDCTLIVSTDVRDTTGNIVVPSPISHWDHRQDGGRGTNISEGQRHVFGPLQFDISPNAHTGIYRLYVSMRFTDSGDNNQYTFNGWVEFKIYDVVVHDPAAVYAGEKFTPLNILLTDEGNGISDVHMNVSHIPTGISFDQKSAWVPGSLPATLGYRIDVERNVSPGVYDLNYELQYTNNHSAIGIQNGVFHIIVEFTPVITASLTGHNITVIQGNQSIPAMGVNFTNAGNVPLRDMAIDLAYDGTFFFEPAAYYEGNASSNSQEPVRVSEVHIDSLGVGETAEGTWYVALNPYIQPGEHKILFTWSATYFDNGATNRATHYVDVQMQWGGNSSASSPLMPEMRFNDGSGWTNWSAWIAGPYVMLDVIDNHTDMSASSIKNDETGHAFFDTSNDSLMNVEISSVIHNFEMVDFLELKASLKVGSGTPFFNPTDHSLTSVENDHVLSNSSISAGGNATMFWHVDVDPNIHPGMYTTYITLSGRNAVTTGYFNTTIPVSVEIRGIGPIPMISSVVTGDVEPGKIFYMNLTIENKGDDTARNVFVMLPGDFGSNWEVIDGFVDSISSYNYTHYGESRSRNVTSNHITLEQLNINDAKDIVGLDLYMRGVYNPPSAEIWLIKTDNLAPGQSLNVSFKMMSNINMVKGKPYEEDVFIRYSDSYGDSRAFVEPLTLRTTSPGLPYNGETNAFTIVTSNSTGFLMLFILFLIFIVLIIGLGVMKDDKEKKLRKEAKGKEEMSLSREKPVDAVVESGEEHSVLEGEELGEDLDVSEEEIEPGFTVPDENEIPESEPGFTLEENENGGSSF